LKKLAWAFGRLARSSEIEPVGTLYVRRSQKARGLETGYMARGSNERQKARPGASLEAMIPRGRYLTWKLRALCWVLRRLRAVARRKRAPVLAGRPMRIKTRTGRAREPRHDGRPRGGARCDSHGLDRRLPKISWFAPAFAAMTGGRLGVTPRVPYEALWRVSRG
jgi:hypothetical protein